ncbi:MAG: hypothetical protein K2N51_05070 [Lachnospiraceae bacterium]|nr:hypothetical protein [Lachnospiraceae bacterium]
MSKVAIALLSNIEASQNEIISAIYSQILEFVEDAVVIDFYANGKIYKVLNGEPETLRLKQYEHNKWSQMQKQIEKYMKEFDKIILFKAPISCTGEVILEMEKGMEQDDSYYMGYDKMRRIYERVTFVKAIRDKEVYHLVIDPREIDFSEFFGFKSYKRVCAWKSKTGKYGPIYEYAMSNIFIQEIPKAQDFYFIGSVYDESKEYLYDIKKEFDKRLGRRHKGGMYNNPFTGKFELFTFENRDKRVGQGTYLYNLMLSRYTIIIDDYVGQFNMMRFMEAIICGCVPLILDGYNNLENLILTFPDIYDIIEKRQLVEKLERVYFRIHDWEEKDQYVIEEIKATKSFKKITNKERVKKYYDKLLR